MKTILVGLALFFAYHLEAQERIVYGIVHTLDSIPLIDAEITVKSTGQIVLTDSLGGFSVGCNEKDRLRVKADGFYGQNVKLVKNTRVVAINLKMKPGSKSGDLNVGYGSISEKDKTGAVNKLEYTDTDFTKYNSVQELIRDNFAGVQLINGEIQIRGSKTLMGNVPVLVVLDGVPVESDILNTLSTFDIKSVSVIKDGTTAVYGSRATGGVILVESKKGGNNIP